MSDGLTKPAPARVLRLQRNGRDSAKAMRGKAEIEPLEPANDSLSVSAYQQIKAAIVSCRIPPGSDVSETQLSELTGLGKAPVRSAVARLSQEGLLRPVPRRGYLVSPITLHDIQENFRVRLLLEPRAARLAAGRLTEAHVRRLYSAVDLSHLGDSDADVADFLRLNKLFHVTIAEASGNQKMAAIIATLLDEVERMLHLFLTREHLTVQFQDEHRELFDALVAGEEDRAETLAYEQIKGGQELLLRSVLNADLASQAVSI